MGARSADTHESPLAPSLHLRVPVIAIVILSPPAWHDVDAELRKDECRCGADADRTVAWPPKALCLELRLCGPMLRRCHGDASHRLLQLGTSQVRAKALAWLIVLKTVVIIMSMCLQLRANW